MVQMNVDQGEHAASKMAAKDKPCVTHSQTCIAPNPLPILRSMNAVPAPPRYRLIKI